MKKKTEKKRQKPYFARIFQHYIETFKEINTDYFYYVFCDLLFFVFVTGVAYVTGNIITNYTGLQTLGGMRQSMDPTQLAYLQQIKTTMSMIFIVIIGALLLMVLSWSFAKVLIYNKIYKHKFDWLVALKFILSNIVICFVFLFVLSSIPLYIMQNKLPIVAFLVILVMLYLLTIYYIVFFKLGKFKKAFTKTMQTAVMQVHKYAVPFLLCAISILFIIIIFSTIIYNIPVARQVIDIVGIILILFVLAWARLYLVKTVNYIAFE